MKSLFLLTLLFLILDDPSQWIIDCEEDDHCPSNWGCYDNYCYPPALSPSFYKYLTPVHNDTVVKYKVMSIKDVIKVYKTSSILSFLS